MAYADLLEDLSDTLDRDDLESRFPRFLADVEARLNRLLDDPEMDTTATATANGASTTLPADFGEMISISTGDGPLSAVGAVEYASFDDSITGTPRSYALIDGGIRFYPANATAQISMVYRRTLPPLTVDNDSNWLLERAPDVYKYGLRFHGEAWSGNREDAAGWKAMWDEAIAELKVDGVRRKWGAGPIRPAIRRA